MVRFGVKRILGEEFDSVSCEMEGLSGFLRKGYLASGLPDPRKYSKGHK